MYVEKTKAGNYKFIERYVDPLTGQTHRVAVRMPKNNAQTRRDAMQLLAAKIEEKSKVIIKHEQATFGDLVDAYLLRSSELVASTRIKNEHNMKYWEKLIGRDTLLDLLPKLNIISMMEKTGEEPKRMNERLVRFKALIHWGYSAGLVESAEFLNRLRAFKAPPHRDDIADKYLEYDEYKRLLPELTVEKWRLVTEFMVLSGMRFGEVAALEAKDVDFEHKVIHVDKTWHEINGETTHAKSRSSIRDVYMQPQLLDVAKKVYSFMFPRRLKAERFPLFFIDDDGGRLHQPAFTKYLKKKSLEVCGREITPHALRHTSASYMYTQGFSDDEVARRLGHMNSRITKRIYIHMTNELQKMDNQKLDKFTV